MCRILSYRIVFVSIVRLNTQWNSNLSIYFTC